MVAPDHWTPILSYSIKNNLKREKIGFMSFSLGLIHGIFSSILSFSIAVIGLYFFPDYYVKIFSISLLIFVALYIILNANHEERIENNIEKKGNDIEKSILLVSIIPDPAIVPIILIAVVYGMHFVYFTISIFVIASAVSLLLITLLLSKILIKKLSKLTPKKVDYIVSIVLLFTALFIVI